VLGSFSVKVENPEFYSKVALVTEEEKGRVT
jgi:hypothetical protein